MNFGHFVNKDDSSRTVYHCWVYSSVQCPQLAKKFDAGLTGLFVCFLTQTTKLDFEPKPNQNVTIRFLEHFELKPA